MKKRKLCTHKIYTSSTGNITFANLFFFNFSPLIVINVVVCVLHDVLRLVSSRMTPEEDESKNEIWKLFTHPCKRKMGGNHFSFR